MRRARSVEPLERQSQAAVVQWWAHACKGYHLPEAALFAIPNGAHLAGDARSRAIKMANLKRQGLRNGVPDLFLAAPIKGLSTSFVMACGLWIEMKRKGGKPSPEQAAFLLYARQRGYHAVICYSSDEAIRAIKAYLA